MGLIFDSSVIIAAERRAHPIGKLLRDTRMTHGSTEIRLSSVTVFELCHGIWRADSPERAAARRLYLEEVFSVIAVEPFTKEIAELAARIDAEARHRGRVVPVADLQIGATAIYMGFDVLTHNARHFEMIPGLLVKRI